MRFFLWFTFGMILTMAACVGPSGSSPPDHHDTTIAKEPGIVSIQPAKIPGEIPPAKSAVIDAAHALKWAAALFLVVAVLTLLAKFIPVIGPFIPPKAAATAGAASMICFVVEYWWLAHGVLVSEGTFWIALAVATASGGAVLWPWLRALWSHAMIKQANAHPHPIAQLALRNAALPHLKKKNVADTVMQAFAPRIVNDAAA